jgi:hypothetical protein
METYRHLMYVSAKLHAAAVLPAGNNPGTHLTGGWVSPRDGLGVLEEKKSLALTGIRIPKQPARSPVAITDYTTPGPTKKLWAD